MATVGISFRGMPELVRRLEAVADTGPIMRELAVIAVGEQKRLAPVRTGNLRRTIHIGKVTRTSAETVASANYAVHVEFGTKAHEIRPRNRQALRWKARGGGVRFAKVVHHPGTRPKPYMIPGAQKAIASVALRDKVIAKWNRAA